MYLKQTNEHPNNIPDAKYPERKPKSNASFLIPFAII